MKQCNIVIISCFLIIIMGCQTPKKKEVISVFCASSLVDIMEELKDSFRVNHGHDIRLNVASSGTLARQIAQGNNTDIYISANRYYAEYLYNMDLFSEHKLLYHNRLVMIAPLNSRLNSVNFLQTEKPNLKNYISMGDPSHVPAGQYAQEVLINLGWWEAWYKKILPAKDVRSALMPVELNECELGIVYYSDALASKKIKILGIFPDSLHSPIIISALLSKSATNGAKDFFAILTSENHKEAWERYGLYRAISD